MCFSLTIGLCTNFPHQSAAKINYENYIRSKRCTNTHTHTATKKTVLWGTHVLFIWKVCTVYKHVNLVCMTHCVHTHTLKSQIENL